MRTSSTEIPFSDEVKLVELLASASAAQRRARDYKSDEDLLLALHDVPKSAAGTFFRNNSTTICGLRREVANIAPSGFTKIHLEPLPPSDRYNEIMDRACGITTELGRSSVGTGEILLAIIQTPGCASSIALSELLQIPKPICLGAEILQLIRTIGN